MSWKWSILVEEHPWELRRRHWLLITLNHLYSEKVLIENLTFGLKICQITLWKFSWKCKSSTSTSELITRQMGNDITNLILGTCSLNIVKVQFLLLHFHLQLNLVPEFPLVDPPSGAPTPPPPLHTSLAWSPPKVTSKLYQHLHPQAHLVQLESNR